MKKEDNPYPLVEKFIDATKLDAEFVPDIYEEDKGKILVVNKHLESEWATLKSISGEDGDDGDDGDKVSVDDIKKQIAGLMITIEKMKKNIDEKVQIGDFEGALKILELLQTSVDILAGRIELATSETNIIGVYLPGNNDIPTTQWSNLVNPIDFAKLVGFMFEQDSGWIGDEKSGRRLMFSGDQHLIVNNPISIFGETANFCIDAIINVYGESDVVEFIDGIYLKSRDGFIEIDTGELKVITDVSVPLGLSHILINICAPIDVYQVFINGEEVKTKVLSTGDFTIPKIAHMFSGLSGEVAEFRIYSKALTSSEIKKNAESGIDENGFVYFALESLFEASKAETIYAEFELVKASITILKDEIKLQVSRLQGLSHLTTAPYKNVRYIREYQNGNSVSKTENRWLEMMCYDEKENNILEGVVPITSAEESYNLDAITDNNRERYATVMQVEDKPIYIEFDLGRIRNDVMYLKTWRYHDDFRRCKDIVTQVSEDKETWITIFDGRISGDFEEQKDGFVIPINMGNYLDKLSYRLQQAEIKITPEGITSTVIDHERFQEYTKKQVEDAILVYKALVDAEFLQVMEATDDLTDTMNGAFKDGVVSEAEAKAINERLVAIEKEKSDILHEFEVIYNKESLLDPYKQNLFTGMENYVNCYLALKDAIIFGIEDSIATEEEIAYIDGCTERYREEHALFQKVFTEAVDAIGDAKINAIDMKYEERCSEIEQTAEKIKMTVQIIDKDKASHGEVEAIEKEVEEQKKEIDKQFIEVNEATTGLQLEMNGAFKDGIISEAEAKVLNERLIAIAKEQGQIGAEYLLLYNNEKLKDAVVKHNLNAAKNSYDSGYNTLKIALLGGIEDGLINAEEVAFINKATDNYRKLGVVYRSAMTKAVDSIGETRTEEIDNKFEKRCSTIEQTTDSISLTVAHMTPVINGIKEELDEYKLVVDKEFDDINNAFNDLAGSLDEAFKDGIVDEMETKMINERLVAMDKENEDITEEYETIYNNKSLSVNIKTNLKSYYDRFISRHESLKTVIGTIISDKKVTDAERRTLAIASSNYSNASASLKRYVLISVDNIGENKVEELEGKTNVRFSAIEVELDSITLQVVDAEIGADRADKKAEEAKGLASTAQKDADSAAADASEALSEATEVFGTVQDMASDAKVTPQEKRILVKDVNAILDEYPIIIEEAKEFKVHYQTFQTYYNSFYSRVVPMFRGQAMHEVTRVSYSSFELIFKNYYVFRQRLLNMISQQAKKLSDEANRLADIAKKEADKKPNKTEILSSINMSTEGIVIKGDRLDLRGLVTMTSLEHGTTSINGACIDTGYIRAIDINACNLMGSHLTGTKMLYMAPTGTAAFDGQTYVRNFRCVKNHENWRATRYCYKRAV